ncbi:MAG: 3-hydroxyacyl-CoA dehydrogenase NAD-binding domain-containing protein [Pseudomonadota bacterium]|nr:3-hydroxyacyl-CoA dehydrogenase NAD-binding domain-containing protein [Pseudomonadota bacterium]MEC8153994.1 3-hydroxyacyl-CoA dehydrogenase NAD-binding domain-containing protein [Pseudomonadota bacterium]
MGAFNKTAVLGGGVIGASWTALFMAAGKDVCVFDVDEQAPEKVTDYVDRAWPTLLELGLAQDGRRGALCFAGSLEEAVDEVDFVQENLPERLDLKLEAFGRIEPRLKDGCIVASSASGLMVREMQAGWKNPSNFVLGHPFNPPHLIPLVEVIGNEQTAPEAIDAAEAFYEEVGKVTIRVNKEVPGHVANRLQAALWREALHLVKEGVATVEDVDTAVWAGPGLRWGAMGPHMLFNLGAGEGGMEAFCDRYAASFHHWWDDLGEPRLDAETGAVLASGLADEAQGRSLEELSAERDALILAHLKAVRGLRRA